MKMERHALASQERIGGLWTCTCTCGRSFAEPVQDDAGRRFWAHQDSFAPSRWEASQPEVPMIPGHEEPCAGCGSLLWIIGDRDALCNGCVGFDIYSEWPPG